MSSGQKQSIELRLHAVEGLPAAGTIIKAEVHLGNGVKWASAAAISHGSTAYLGAWVAVQPAGAELLLRVHDRDVRSLTHCSSGTVSAHAVLPLPMLAPGAAAAADGAAAEQAPDEQGWRHVSLAMQEGRAARLAHAVEQSLGEAARREDVRQAAQHPEDSRPVDAEVEAGVSSAMAAQRSHGGTGGADAPARAAQPQSREAGREGQQLEGEQQQEAAHGEQAAAQAGRRDQQHSLGSSEVTQGPEVGHVVIEMPAVAGSQPTQGGEEGQQAPAEAAEAGQGPPHHSDSLQPFRGDCLTMHLSYRPLRQPPSSLLSAEHASAAARSLAATRSLAAARTFIRLLSWKAPSTADGAGGPGHDDDDVERQQRGVGGAEEARFRRWMPGVPAARGGEELPDALQEGRLLELPLAPLPLHLHSYGHGAFMGAALSLLGDRRWQGLLRREDPQAFASAKRLAASLKLLASSRRKQGVARLHLAMMPCLENNPVLAAYGAVRSGSAAQLQPGEAPSLDSDSAAAALQAAGDDLRAAAAAVAPDAAAAAEVLADPVAPAGEPGAADPTVAPAQQEMAAGGGGECGAAAGADAEGSKGGQGPQESRLVAGLRRRGHPAAADKIQRYLQSVLLPNRYGYRPIAQEWDIWVDPERPEDVRAAGISHGSARQLVTQAVATAVPCTRSCARSAGQTLIRAQGKSPVDWLNAFGSAINAAVQGSRGVPLPLAEPPAACLRLRLTLHAVHGVPTGAWERPYLKAKLASSTVRVPKCRTGRGKAQGDTSFAWSRQESGGRPRWLWPAPGGGGNGGGGAAAQQGAALSFWPLLPGFEGGDTVDLELRGDPAGLLADTQVGRALLPLAELSRRCPQLLEGEQVRLEVPLRHDSHAAAAAAATAPTSELAAQGGEPALEGQDGAGGHAVAASEPVRGGEAAEASGELGPQPAAASPGPSAPAAGPGLSPAGAAAAAVQGAARRVLHTVAAPAAALLGVGAGRGPAPASPANSGAFYFSVAPADGSGSAGAAGTKAPGDEGPAASEPSAAAGPRLELTAALEWVDCLEAAVAAGLEPAAAQTCLAMLADPGGLYLDVKSAYSTPRDLELFVSALKGLGIHTKAVCSFQPRQLQVSPGLSHTVLFFHGLSGLENACDAKRIAPGQFVLFNGASFLADLSPGGMQLPEDRAAELLGSCRQFPVDALVLRRYKGLVEQYGFAGGIYVQEPDTSASAAQALIGLVAANEAYFPLGFAYGHLRDAAVSVLELGGRGFASQEILEELASRGELSAKVVSRINAGEHRGVSANVAATWAGRLVSSSRLLSLREQRALIALLAELPPGDGLLAVLDDLGGIPRVVLRFFQHYEHWTPMTLLEAGYNLNRQKAFLRLLRNHGALAALPLHRKIELARFFVGPQLRGYGLTYLLQLTRLRLGLHKHAKEGLLCLLESCTRRELEGVLLALGGRARVVRKLRGRLRLSWHYTGRLAAVEGLHAELPQALAYEQTGLKYAALPGKLWAALTVSVLEELAAREKGVGEGGDAEAGAPPFNHLHTRKKSKRERLLKQARKLGCCAFSLGNCLALNLVTIGLFTLCCLYPRALGATFKGTCPMPALVAFVLGMAVAVGLYIVLAGLIGDVGFL